MKHAGNTRVHHAIKVNFTPSREVRSIQRLKIDSAAPLVAARDLSASRWRRISASSAAMRDSSSFTESEDRSSPSTISGFFGRGKSSSGSMAIVKIRGYCPGDFGIEPSRRKKDDQHSGADDGDRGGAKRQGNPSVSAT